MTRNQIMYQELQQTIRRDQAAAEVARGTLKENSRHNVQMEQETYRHNLETERVARMSLEETGRHNLAVEQETHRHNVVMEEQGSASLEVKRYEAETGRMNALTNIRNSEINMYNAESGRIQAHAAQTSAAAAYMNAQTNQQKVKQDYLFGLLDYQVKSRSNDIKMYEAESNRMGAYTRQYSAETERANSETKRYEAYLKGEQFELDFKRYLDEHQESAARIQKILSDKDLNVGKMYQILVDTIYTEDRNTREWLKAYSELYSRAIDTAKSIFGAYFKSKGLSILS